MNEEEKKVVELLEHCQNTYIEDILVTRLQLTTEEAKILLNLIKKQQKEIEELKDKNKTLEQLLQGNLYEMYKYYRELANSYQANCISKDKIRELKEKVEKEMISNPYDFSYMLNELLGEKK